MTLAHPLVLITGASRGIGAAVARLAAARGYDVLVNYRSDRDAAERVVADCRALGAEAHACPGDMAVEAEVLRVFDEANRLGQLRHVINNAGITGRSGRLENTSAEIIGACIDLNVTGALLVAREAARRLSSKQGGSGGSIVNISSVAATLGSPGEYVWYAASNLAHRRPELKFFPLRRIVVRIEDGAIGRNTLSASLLLLLLASLPALADEPCRSENFGGSRYTVCSFDLANSNLRLFWRNGSGEPFRSFSSLAGAVEENGGVLTFAMNAGMFETDFTPMGLHVEDGLELRPANTANAPAGAGPVPNFYKKPNGVFYIAGDEAGVLTTERFMKVGHQTDYATQSGPMLVIDGELHPAFIEGSRDRTRRTGVGVSGPGMVHFAISEARVNFHDFARFFRDLLECRNALFLDGGRGTGLYSPELGRNDRSWHGGFGPIIGAVEQ